MLIWVLSAVSCVWYLVSITRLAPSRLHPSLLINIFLSWWIYVRMLWECLDLSVSLIVFIQAPELREVIKVLFLDEVQVRKSNWFGPFFGTTKHRTEFSELQGLQKDSEKKIWNKLQALRCEFCVNIHKAEILSLFRKHTHTDTHTHPPLTTHVKSSLC